MSFLSVVALWVLVNFLRAKGVLAPKIRIWDENFSVIGSWIPPFKQARFSVRLPVFNTFFILLLIFW